MKDRQQGTGLMAVCSIFWSDRYLAHLVTALGEPPQKEMERKPEIMTKLACDTRRGWAPEEETLESALERGGGVGSWKIWARVLQMAPVGVDSEIGALGEGGSLQGLGQTRGLEVWGESRFCG